MFGRVFNRRKAKQEAPSEDGMPRIYDPVPVTLLTGFLGSGKTTLLNQLLEDPEMAGTAVIVNEFGTVPVDHDLVRIGSESYFRTTTGCICCTAASDIRVSLYELHEARLTQQVPPISRVIIETTGLADPAPIINSLIPGGAYAHGLRDHVVARQFFLSGVLTAFDVLAGRETLDTFIEGWKQLAFADHIVLTKTDLAGDSAPWTEELRGLNPAAAFHDCHAPGFCVGNLIGTRTYSVQGKAEDVPGWLAMESMTSHGHHHHDLNRHGDKVQAISLTHDEPLDARAVMTFLDIVTSNAHAGVLRLKGIFLLTDQPGQPAVAHAVQHRLYPLKRLERWPEGNRNTRLVLIGQDMPEKQIRELFETITPRPARRPRSLA